MIKLMAFLTIGPLLSGGLDINSSILVLLVVLLAGIAAIAVIGSPGIDSGSEGYEDYAHDLIP